MYILQEINNYQKRYDKININNIVNASCYNIQKEILYEPQNYALFLLDFLYGKGNISQKEIYEYLYDLMYVYNEDEEPMSYMDLNIYNRYSYTVKRKNFIPLIEAKFFIRKQLGRNIEFSTTKRRGNNLYFNTTDLDYDEFGNTPYTFNKGKKRKELPKCVSMKNNGLNEKIKNVKFCPTMI